jgi:hypothetical protein
MSGCGNGKYVPNLVVETEVRTQVREAERKQTDRGHEKQKWEGPVVERGGDLSGQFQMLLLIFSHRHVLCSASRMVRVRECV